MFSTGFFRQAGRQHFSGSNAKNLVHIEKETNVDPLGEYTRFQQVQGLHGDVQSARHPGPGQSRTPAQITDIVAYALVFVLLWQ